MMSFTGSTMLKDPLRVRGKRPFKDDLVESARDSGRVAVLKDVSPESHSGRPRFYRPLPHLQPLPLTLYLRSPGDDDRDGAGRDHPLETLGIARIQRLHYVRSRLRSHPRDLSDNLRVKLILDRFSPRVHHRDESHLKLIARVPH